MNYVKKNTSFMRIPKMYHQNFMFNPREIPNRALMVGLYLNDTIDDYDLDILEFLEKCNFAVERQIKRFCGGNNIEYVKERLDILFKNRMINKFALMEDKKYNKAHPADAEEIYCLAEGGKMILDTYRDSTLIWDFSKITSGSKAIAKALIDTEIWLDITYNTKIPLIGYEKYPSFAINKRMFTFGSQFRFKLGKSSKGSDMCSYMLCDTYHGDDDLLTLRRRFSSISSLLKSDYWRRYFHDSNEAPLMVFIVENDEMALMVAKEFTTIGGVRDDGFRLTTSERLIQGIDSPSTFLKYNYKEDALYETTLPIFAQ